MIFTSICVFLNLVTSNNNQIGSVGGFQIISWTYWLGQNYLLNYLNPNNNGTELEEGNHAMPNLTLKFPITPHGLKKYYKSNNRRRQNSRLTTVEESEDEFIYNMPEFRRLASASRFKFSTSMNQKNQSENSSSTNKKKKSKSKVHLDRFELNCTTFEQIMIDGPVASLQILKNELCISLSKIPQCQWFCKEQRNIKKKYRFACLDKTLPSMLSGLVVHNSNSNESVVEFNYEEQIIYKINHGQFVDLTKFGSRKLKKTFPSGCVRRL